MSPRKNKKAGVIPSNVTSVGRMFQGKSIPYRDIMTKYFEIEKVNDQNHTKHFTQSEMALIKDKIKIIENSIRSEGKAGNILKSEKKGKTKKTLNSTPAPILQINGDFDESGCLFHFSRTSL